MVAKGAETPHKVRLRFVRLHLGKGWMEAAVDDLVAGKPRLIRYTWKERGREIPPDDWFDAIVGEVRYQRTQDWKRAQGRLMPWEDG